MGGRRVLILAHPFPPAGGGGVQRTTKLVKYLPKYGWTPTVLTTQASLYPIHHNLRDDTLLRDIPQDVRIVRVPSPEILPDPPSVAGKAWRWVLRPDRARLWNLVALPVALGLHAKERFDVVYATGGPFSTYLLARNLSSATGVPYVADMRDAWLQQEKRTVGSKIAEARFARLERKMLLDARFVVFVTKPMEDAHLRVYPDLNGRTAVIKNGFDEADYPEMPRPGPIQGPSDPVVFTYSGTMNWYIRPEVLFDGFRIARANDEAFRRRARLRLVGRVGTTPKEREEFVSAMNAPGLDDAVEEYGYRPHPETVLLQRTADALVLLTSGRPDEQCGKAAEYVAAGRPILGLVLEGTPADEMISNASVVERAPPSDRDGAARALLRLFAKADARRPEDPLPATGPALYPITRSAAAAQMAEVFDAACRPE